MNGAKVTKVLLEVPAYGMRQDFDFSHAERLLKMPNNGGWALPEGSPFEMTKDGLKYRANTKGNKGKQERADSE